VHLEGGRHETSVTEINIERNVRVKCAKFVNVLKGSLQQKFRRMNRVKQARRKFGQILKYVFRRKECTVD
jgi:hypothetical protein